MPCAAISQAAANSMAILLLVVWSGFGAACLIDGGTSRLALIQRRVTLPSLKSCPPLSLMTGEVLIVRRIGSLAEAGNSHIRWKANSVPFCPLRMPHVG